MIRALSRQNTLVPLSYLMTVMTFRDTCSTTTEPVMQLNNEKPPMAHCTSNGVKRYDRIHGAHRLLPQGHGTHELRCMEPCSPREPPLLISAFDLTIWAGDECKIGLEWIELGGRCHFRLSRVSPHHLAQSDVSFRQSTSSISTWYVLCQYVTLYTHANRPKHQTRGYLNPTTRRYTISA